MYKCKNNETMKMTSSSEIFKNTYDNSYDSSYLLLFEKRKWQSFQISFLFLWLKWIRLYVQSFNKRRTLILEN